MYGYLWKSTRVLRKFVRYKVKVRRKQTNNDKNVFPRRQKNNTKLNPKKKEVNSNKNRN